MKTVTTFISNRFKFLMMISLTVVAFIPMIGISQSSPATVDLGTAGNFVIMAKTGISTTGVTAITGDIGISPTAATYVTGFGLIMDPSGTFSTSSLITGKIYASDYTDPTPSKMTTSVGDMETAYTNAAGRTLPDYSELYTGDLTGKTLTRGLYKWGTAVTVGDGGVTISGSSTDIWIFQVSQNLVLANGAMVTLAGGAQASNIFWQVAGQVTIGTTASMKGIILCQTAIILNTGASLDGRALAQSAVSLDANAVTTPTVVTSAIDGVATPQKFNLFQNYPNPFNPTTNIEFTVPSNGRTTLKIFNALGQEVATLFNGVAEAGKYNQVQFNATDLATGLYFSRLEFAGNVQSKKMMLVK